MPDNSTVPKTVAVCILVGFLSLMGRNLTWGANLYPGQLQQPNSGVIHDAQPRPVDDPVDDPDDESEKKSTKTPTKTDAQLEQAEKIEELMGQLDSLDFATRESAADQLCQIGEPAIGPLAYRSLSGSPETSWRIKKTLERICTQGTRDVFYKSSGILTLRFPMALSSDNAELQKQWQANRKQVAIAKLRKLGATVEDPFENSEGFPPVPQVFQFGGGVIINGRIVEMRNEVPTESAPQQAAKQAPPTIPQPVSKPDLKSSFKKILDSDWQEIRRLVSEQDQQDKNVLRDNDVEASLPNQVFADLVLRPQGVGSARAGLGVRVHLSDRWTGTNQDLATLAEIPNVTDIELNQLSLTRDSIETIAAVPDLARLVIDDCKFAPDDFAISNWPLSLTRLEFSNQDITSALAQQWTAIPALQFLSFSRCQVEIDALNEMGRLRSLGGLDFADTELDGEVFAALANLKRLSYINLTACKFATKDYQRLMTKRPNLQIQFTPQAFLGVRGPIGGANLFNQIDEIKQANETPGCLISEVIADSGADKAGIKSGDVIEKVNGQAVSEFLDLRLHIAQCRPGEKLDVDVNRNGKSLRMTITLGDIKSADPY